MMSKQLDLFPPGAVGCGADTPWRGQSPRSLCRVSLASSFRAEGMGRLDQNASPVGEDEQKELLQQLLFPFSRRYYG